MDTEYEKRKEFEGRKIETVQQMLIELSILGWNICDASRIWLIISRTERNIQNFLIHFFGVVNFERKQTFENKLDV